MPIVRTDAVHRANHSSYSAFCTVIEDGIRVLGWVVPYRLAHAPLFEPLHKSAHQRFTCTWLHFGHYHACMDGTLSWPSSPESPACRPCSPPPRLLMSTLAIC